MSRKPTLPRHDPEMTRLQLSLLESDGPMSLSEWTARGGGSEADRAFLRAHIAGWCCGGLIRQVKHNGRMARYEWVRYPA